MGPIEHLADAPVRKLTCPECGSQEVRRAHRRPLEKLIFFLKPYRCSLCDHRFLAREQ